MRTRKLNAFMLIYFLTFNTYKCAFPLFPFYSFDNDDMKSSKRHAVLLSLIFLIKYKGLIIFFKAYIVLTTFRLYIYEVLTFDPAGAALNKASYGQAPQDGWFNPQTLSHTGQLFTVILEFKRSPFHSQFVTTTF